MLRRRNRRRCMLQCLLIATMHKMLLVMLMVKDRSVLSRCLLLIKASPRHYVVSLLMVKRFEKAMGMGILVETLHCVLGISHRSCGCARVGLPAGRLARWLEFSIAIAVVSRVGSWWGGVRDATLDPGACLAREEGGEALRFGGRRLVTAGQLLVFCDCCTGSEGIGTGEQIFLLKSQLASELGRGGFASSSWYWVATSALVEEDDRAGHLLLLVTSQAAHLPR